MGGHSVGSFFFAVVVVVDTGQGHGAKGFGMAVCVEMGGWMDVLHGSPDSLGGGGHGPVGGRRRRWFWGEVREARWCCVVCAALYMSGSTNSEIMHHR